MAKQSDPDKSVFAELSHPEIISVLDSIDSSTYYPIRSEAEVTHGGLTGENYHHNSDRRHSCSSYEYSNSSLANPSYGNGRLVEAKTSPTMSAPAASLGGLSLMLLLYAEVRLTPRSLPQTMQLFVNNIGIIVNTDETTGWLTVLLFHERTPLKFCITSKQASYLTPLTPAQGDLVRIIKGKYVGKMGRLFSIPEGKVEAIVEFNTGEMAMNRLDQIIKLNSSYTNSVYSTSSNRPATLPISSDSHMITQSSPMVGVTSTNSCISDYSQAGHMTSHTSPTDSMSTNHMIVHNRSSNVCMDEQPQLVAQNDAPQSYSSDHHMTSNGTTQGYINSPANHMTTQGCTSDVHTAQVCTGNGGHMTTPIPSPMSNYQRSPLPYTNNCMSPTSPWGNSHQHVTTPSPYGPQVLSPVSPASSVCDMGTEQYDMPNPPSSASWAVGYANPTQSLPSNGVYANGTCKSFLQPPHFVYIPTTITSCNTGALSTTPGTAQWPTATCGGVTATFGTDEKTYYGTPPSYVDHRTAVQYMLAAQVRGMYPSNAKPAYRQYVPPTTYTQVQSLRSPRLTYGPSPFVSLPTHLTPKTPSAAPTTPATPQQSCPQTSSKTEPKSTICDELKSLLCGNKCDDPYNKGMMLIKKNGCDFVINKLLDKLETLDAPPNWYDPLSKNEGDCDLSTKCIRVSANCPVTKHRMEYPCRGLHCTHLQCFDAKAFLQMIFKRKLASMGSQMPCKPCPSGGWKCPICNKALTPKQLFIEKHLKKLINNSSVNELEFQGAGLWEIVVDDSKPSTSSVIDLTLESDDDG